SLAARDLFREESPRRRHPVRRRPPGGPLLSRRRGKSMTTLLAWTSKARQEALLLADDRVAGSSQRREKIQVLYGRWAVGVYGSALLQWGVEDLCYFNDKAKRPAIRSVVALLGLLGRVAQKTLPTRLRWLAQAGLPAHQIEA